MKVKLKLKLAMVICLLGLASCASPEFKAYVNAHRLNHDVMGPHYSRYIQADPTLDEAAKRTFLRRVEAEEEMINSAEQALGLKPVVTR